jgi:iron complex transport system ATP-binding protein
MSLIELKNISFHYNYPGKKRPDFLLDDISAVINMGEFISILGPNGSGKSTLLKNISGLLKPISGELLLKGKNYKHYSIRDLARHIAFVQQTSDSVFSFSVYEIVMMGRTPYLNYMGFEKDEDRKIVDEILELLELKHLRNKGINEISGGEAQLAYIARALVQKPEIILLDEPNAHLDIKHQISIFNLIKKVSIETGLTVISVSHDINLTGFFSDRIILMKNGKIYKDDKTNSIISTENIKNVFEVDTEIIISPDSSSANVFYKPPKLQ